MEKEKNQQNSSAAFKIGAVSLAFLILGYQGAIFVHRAAELRIEANRDSPDTVYVYVSQPCAVPVRDASGAEPPIEAETVGDASPGESAAGKAAANVTDMARRVERRYAEHTPAVEKVRDATRKVESFAFNPNTAGLEDLKRLGFSAKQAQSILNYRASGGRFRRKEDFARSFVVADSVYARLEDFIEIPRLDINRADSADFDALPGIGPWFASKMVAYREKIGGYTATEQLMDIDRFDSERYEALRDLITCGPRSGDDGSGQQPAR